MIVMTYTFGYSTDVRVSCPELDAFIADLRAVFQKHGVELYLDGWGDPPRIELKQYDGADVDWLTSNLCDADDKIPWIAAAKKEWHKQHDDYHARKRRLNEERVATAQRAREQAMIEQGVELQGRRYKLVEERDG